MLDWRGVNLQLGGRTVLCELNLQLRPGERVGLLGGSGNLAGEEKV